MAADGAGPGGIIAAAREVLDRENGVETDYVALVDPDTFDDVDDETVTR